MNDSLLLSLEQEFKVKVFADQLQFLSTEELQELVVDLYQNSLVQEKLFQKILGEYLGVQPALHEN
ncbi:MAG: phycobilisome degradation family protein [Acaryochloridaceae cyanobacterium RL_2_7]|nr:phycobilisome degradation family protein [Acaryochloridaceae cyanobacterium RL_2_7]